MPSIINATTTNGLVTSADNSGSLQLQTNSGTTAVTIDTSQRVGVGTTTPAFPLDVNTTIQDSANFASSNANMDIYLKASGTTSGFTRLRATGGDMVFITGLNERMRIDSSGRVTMVSQPAFTARGFSNTNSGVKTFSSVPLNVGSHYNNSNGRFTAPVAGEYYISCSYLVQSGYTDIQFGLRVNGSDWAELKTGGSTVFTTSWSGVIPLAANDYVDFNYVSGNTNAIVTGNAFGQFSGFLLG